MLWQTFAQSAVSCNSLQLDRITHKSHGAPINFKKADFLKQRSPFRWALAARALLQLYSECENKRPSHQPDSKLLSTRKNKACREY